MGSLMAGWSTSPSPPDEAIKRSSSSLTKEEVEKFWRTKQLLMQEHLEEANKDAALSPRARIGRAISDEIDAQQKLAAEGLSMSLPESSSSSRAWWTKTKWAFLNDPPAVLDSRDSKYVPQFDVASLGQLQPEHPAF